MTARLEASKYRLNPIKPMCEMPGCTFPIEYVGVAKAIGPFKTKLRICAQHAFNMGVTDKYLGPLFRRYRCRREVRRIA